MSKHAPIYAAMKVLGMMVKQNGYKIEHAEALKTVSDYVKKHRRYDAQIDLICKNTVLLEKYMQGRVANTLNVFRKRMEKCLWREKNENRYY